MILQTQPALARVCLEVQEGSSKSSKAIQVASSTIKEWKALVARESRTLSRAMTFLQDLYTYHFDIVEQSGIYEVSLEWRHPL